MPYDFPTNPASGTVVMVPDGSYRVWDSTKWRASPSSSTITTGPFLPIAGGVMSGALSLFGNATSALHAVPLQQLTAATAGGPFLPLAGGSMTGPLNYTATGATTSRAAQDRAAEVVNVKDYGAKCDGTTDDTTAVNAAISYVSSAGGGTVTFPRGTCLMLGAMVIPYTGTTSPTQAPIRLTGVGGNPDSYLGSRPPSVPIGGTVLDMRYAGSGSAVAKIDTRGSGILEIDHLTIIDGTPHASYSNTLFVQTTNTTLLIHDCRFRGDTGAAGTVCLQDCIRLGAIVTGGGLGTNAATAGFQGYGTKIDNNQFDYIREGVQFGSAANSVYLANNIFTINCGAGSTSFAAYHFYGIGPYGSSGNTIYGGVIELSNYPYGVVMTSSGGAGINKSNVLDSVGLYDENMGAPTLGGFYFDANSVFNLIYVGFADQPLQGGPLVQGPGVQANVVINALGSGTRFPYGITIGQDTVDTTLTIAGSNAASNGGSSIFFNNNGVLAGAIGNYSRIIGGAYSNVFTLYAGGDNIAMPSDNLSVHTGAAPTCLLDIGNGTGTQVLKFSGGNTNAADGARISFFNGASAVAHLGNYSSVQGGAYSSVFTILANGSGVTLPVDNLAIHTGAAPTAVLDVGPGTGGQNVQLNGGNTGANDGVRITFNNAGAPVGYIGNYSAINGGGYNNRFTLYGATRGILIPSDKVGIATGSALNSVGGEIGIGDGTGIRRIVMNGGNTATADGTILLFYNNSGRIGGVGNSSSYFNTAYATYGRSTTLAGYDSVIFSSHDLEAGRIVGNPTTQRWLIGTPTDDTATLLQVGGTCRINGNVGFNNTAPIAKPTLTGAWAGNTAGKALATLLASYGLLTDSSTA